MRDINYFAVFAAAVAAFVLGALWYSPLLFGGAYLAVRGQDPQTLTAGAPPLWELLGELLRELVVAYVLARFIVRLGVRDWTAALRVGAWVWVGFQAMLLVGAVLHEGMPPLLYVIHAGDALVKTLLMALILGVWRRQPGAEARSA